MIGALRRIFLRIRWRNNRRELVSTEHKLEIMRRAVETGNEDVIDMTEVLLRGGAAAKKVRRVLGFDSGAPAKRTRKTSAPK